MSSQNQQNFTPSSVLSEEGDNINHNAIITAEVHWEGVREVGERREIRDDEATFFDSAISNSAFNIENLPVSVQEFYSKVSQLIKAKQHLEEDHPSITHLTEYVIENLHVLDQLKTLMPDLAKYYILKANVLLAVSLNEDALIACNEATKLDNTLIEICYVKKYIFMRLKLINEMSLEYDKIIAYDPTNPSLYVDKGDALKAFEEYEDALAAYSHAIELNSKCIEAYFGQAQVLIELERIPQAITVYDQMIQLNPYNPEFYYDKGCLFKDLELYDDAIQAFNLAIIHDPYHSEANYNKGRVLLEMDQYDYAIQAFNLAITNNPSHSMAHYYKGCTLLKMKQYKDAEIELDYVIDNFPECVAACDTKLDLLLSVERFDEVIPLCDMIIERDQDVENVITIQLKKIKALIALGRVDDALATHDKNIDLQPDNSDVYYEKTALLQSLKQYDEAIAECNRIIAHFPKETKAYSIKASILDSLGQYDQAIQEYKNAIDIDPMDTWLYYELCTILEKLGYVIEHYEFSQKLREIEEINATLEDDTEEESELSDTEYAEDDSHISYDASESEQQDNLQTTISALEQAEITSSDASSDEKEDVEYIKKRLDDLGHLHNLRYEELEQYSGKKVATQEELGAHTMVSEDTAGKEFTHDAPTSSPESTLVMSSCTGQDALLDSVMQTC